MPSPRKAGSLTDRSLFVKHTLLLFSVLFFALIGLLVLSSGCRSDTSSSSAVSEVKVFVEEDGIYALSYADLIEVGLDLGTVDPSTIRLLSQGQDVPIAVTGQETESTVLFYGTAKASPYSRQNVYWLSVGGDEGRRMGERAVSSASCSAPADSFLDTVHWEEDAFYVAKVPAGAGHWYGHKLIAPESSTVGVSLPHLAAGDGVLRLSLLGYTSDAVDPDHHLRIHFNDCAVGEALWDGQGPHAIEATLPHSCLQDGENLLTVEAPGDTGAQVDIVLVDWVEVDYQRLFVAEDDRLEFLGQSGRHSLTGFTDEQIWLFDISDPLNVVLIGGPAVEGRGQEYSVSFLDEEPRGHRYVAVSQAGFKSPAGITAVTEMPDLRSSDNQADYIVITHEDFKVAIQPLAEWRDRQGLDVKVVTVTEVYDEFSYGLVDPVAIRGFLRHAHRSWSKPAPQYVLLVGDASYDYQDNLQGPNKSLVPSYLIETAFSGQTTSDNWFVSLDDDGLPDMAIGRLPVQTAEQARAVVNKIIAYEKDEPPGVWRERIVLIADGDEAIFAQRSDVLAGERIPSSYEVVRIHAASTEDAQTEIAYELAEGSLIVNYIGHGSMDTWSGEMLFSSEQIPALRNDGRQPLMIMMSCLLGFFAHPEHESMAEELLLVENGGAIAVFAPSSLTLSSDQAELNQALFNALLMREVPTVGLAIMEAKLTLDFHTQDQRDVIETFTLFGDPALRLVRPD